jgi:hypothetical protein
MIGVHPWQRLAMANEIAIKHAIDPNLRGLAAHITQRCRNMRLEAGPTIALWVRRKMKYVMEAPDTELLQGPYDTLTEKCGDCDDLAILWACLVRSLGLRAYVGGVSAEADMENLEHAVGVLVDDAGAWKMFETIDDTRYGGTDWPLTFEAPQGYCVTIWSNEPDRQGYTTRKSRGETTMGYGRTLSYWPPGPMGQYPPKQGSGGGSSSSGGGETEHEAWETGRELLRQIGYVWGEYAGPESETTQVYAPPQTETSAYTPPADTSSLGLGSVLGGSPLILIAGLGLLGVVVWLGIKG